MVVLFDLLFEKLQDAIPDSHERTRVILEDMLYFADINPFNIYITKIVLDPSNEFKLNCYTGDTLKMDIKVEFKLEKFDIVVGNPPYNAAQTATGKRGGGDSLWHKFTLQTIAEWTRGYVSFVHPSGWRKPESDKSKYIGMFKIMTLDNQMLYLEMHDTNAGKKTFNAGTRYDWYVIECIPRYTATAIKDENGILTDVNLSGWLWLPNYAFDMVYTILATDEQRCDIIYSRNSYGTDKKWIASTQTDEFKHPLIHSTPKNGTRFMYSSVDDRGHFGISKVIFGDSGIYNAIVDMDGKYGMTQHAMAIVVDSVDMGNRIKQALETVKFKQVLKSCMWSNYQIDWRLFTYIKQDFWRQFV
jgi:hypothetical protein